MTVHTFRCGHPIEEGNLITAGHNRKPRCRTCKLRLNREHKRKIRAGIRTDPKSINHAFLTALHRAHPYVFDDAELHGRLAVRP